MDISSEGVVPLRSVPDVIGKLYASEPGRSQCASAGSGLSWSRPELS